MLLVGRVLSVLVQSMLIESASSGLGASRPMGDEVCHLTLLLCCRDFDDWKRVWRLFEERMLE